MIRVIKSRRAVCDNCKRLDVDGYYVLQIGDLWIHMCGVCLAQLFKVLEDGDVDDY